MTVKHTNYFNGDIQTYDDVFTGEQLNNIAFEISALTYGYGSIDDVKSLHTMQVPTGMVSVGKGNDNWFKIVEDYCRKNIPELKDMSEGRHHVNLFSPRENAMYHEDSKDGWTVILYANQYWDINEGGETKFILPVDMMENNEGIKSTALDYPVVLSIAPVPGRLLLFKGNLLHSATGFRNTWRFTPTIQFFEKEDNL